MAPTLPVLPSETLETRRKGVVRVIEDGGVVVRGVIGIVVAYLLGRLGFRLVWVMAMAAVWWAYMKSNQRYAAERQRHAARNKLRKPKEAFNMLMGSDLPSWVAFPDKERAEWMNRLIRQLWPNICEATQQTVFDTVNPILKEYCPIFLSHLGLGTFDLGHAPLLVTGIKTYNTDNANEVIFDLDVEFIGEPNIALEVGALRQNVMKVSLRNIQFRGSIRIILSPLLNEFPCIGAVSVSFLEKPHIDFALQTMSVNVMAVPGLDAWLINLIKHQLAEMFVWPRKMVVPLIDLSEEELRRLNHAEPQGILKLTVMSAENLPKVDLFGACDPYFKIRLGEQKQKTSIKKKTLNAVWEETFLFDVMNPESDRVCLNLYDHDNVGRDRVLGECDVAVASLVAHKEEDIWLPIKLTKTGSIHLRALYTPFGKEENLEQEQGANPAKNPIERDADSEVSMSTDTAADLTRGFMTKSGRLASSRLYITLLRAENLPAVDLNGKSDPYVKFRLGNKRCKSAVIRKNVNPKWNESFVFNVMDAKRETLQVEVRDKDMFRSNYLGAFEIPLSDLKFDQEQIQSFKLTDAISGTVLIKSHLKPITE